MRAASFFLVLFVLLVPSGAEAAGDFAPGPWARVASVVDGDTVTLDPPVAGAGEVRLVGVQAPKIALGRSGFKDWPLGGEARAALARLVLGKRVRLFFGGRRMDRHGRHLAHLFLEDGTWVQGEMLTQGMARVYSFADNRARVADMLALEADARAARRGLWADPFYAVHDGADEARLLGLLGTFQVIEGRVLDAARVKGTVYLNFGADWRTDFTVRIRSRAGRLFKAAGIDPQTFEDQVVRVRGWLDKRDGPEVEATHPEQIEIVK